MNRDQQIGDQDEYVFLDLGCICLQADLPPSTPYVLSGLDTLNPVLSIGDSIKLIGEYQETMGTCYVFSEDKIPAMLHPETGPSETNLIKDTCIIDPNQATSKQVELITGLHKVLKFRLATETENETADNIAPESS